MKATSKNTSKAPAQSTVAQRLQEVLKQTYACYLLTHNYHWNVEGPQFASLHIMFEQQYTELFAAIDEIAERIRALDAYALPNADYDAIASDVRVVPNPLKEGGKAASQTADQMIRNLVTLNANVIESLQAAKHAAEDNSDDETVDLTVGRITVHEKASWMLKSLLK